jgi:putative Mg2+ transporter-C (MgtC) family protein
VEFSFSPLAGIAIAAVLGGVVGIQRQAAAKPAGLRTHLLVAAASAGFTAMGAHLHDTRIPSYVVVGIGFLGSGAIVRHGATSRGLTTAASIWMVAAIGLALGYSNSFGLFAGLCLTAITVVALILSDAEIMRIFHIPVKATIRVTSLSPRTAAQEIRQTLAAANVRVENANLVSVTTDGAAEIAELEYLVVLPRGGDVSNVVREVGSLSSVRKVECAEPQSGA